MYGLSGFVEKLTIQNCVNSTKNCVHYMYIYRKIEYLELRKFDEKLSTLYAQNVWVCQKIGNQELCKLNVKLCILNVRIVWI